MGLAVALVAAAVSLAGALTHDGMTDDERGACRLLIGLTQSLTNLLTVVAVNLDDVPVPRLILQARIFRDNLGRLGGKLNLVGIEEHDKVVEPQMAGYTACAL